MQRLYVGSSCSKSCERDTPRTNFKNQHDEQSIIIYGLRVQAFFIKYINSSCVWIVDSLDINIFMVNSHNIVITLYILHSFSHIYNKKNPNLGLPEERRKQLLKVQILFLFSSSNKTIGFPKGSDLILIASLSDL